MGAPEVIFFQPCARQPVTSIDTHSVHTLLRQRWRLNDEESARTSIESMVFDEDPNNSGGISLRDFRAAIPAANYSMVNVEVAIGAGPTAERLTGTAYLVQKPAGSGRWRLQTEP